MNRLTKWSPRDGTPASSTICRWPQPRWALPGRGIRRTGAAGGVLETGMKTRKLGDSDLEVSEISLGSWLTYGVGVEADRARACLDEAFNQGINFVDTANVYGRGAAETFLGQALQGRPRDSYVLATKLFFPMSESDRGLS